MTYKAKLKSVWSIIKNYKWKSIFFSYMKKLFFMLLIPTMILSLGIFSLYHSSNTNIIKSSNLQSALKTQGSVEKILSDINKINYTLFNNKSVAASVLSLYEDLNKKETIRQRKYVLGILKDYLNSSETIDSIYIYSMQSNFVISGEMCCDADDFFDKSWLKTYKATGKTAFIQSSFPENNGTDKTLLTFVYPFNSSSTPDGLFVINIRLNTLNELFKGNDTEVINLINKNGGEIIYSSDNSLINSKFSHKIPKFKEAICQIDGDSIYCFGKIENYPLILITKSQAPDVIKFQKLLLLFALYFLILSLLLIIMSFFLSSKFYFDISDIVMELGLSTEKSPNNTNELQFLKTNILNSLSKLETIEYELYKKSDKLKTSQQIALQMQISPHFILNTLNVENLFLLTSEHQNDKVVKINSLLSEILVNVLSAGKYIITLNEEIEYTKKYIEIEKIKSMDDFFVEWDVSPQCLKAKTVKFILQPIIENAIFHGIRYRHDKKGKIKITIKRNGDNIIFNIFDNGRGMTKKTAEDLNSATLSNSETTLTQNEHIGFLNVNARIKLAYGNAYGLRVVNSNSNGTIIQITIPYFD